MKKQIQFFMLAACFILLSGNILAQVVISDNASATADPAAVLDVQSDTRGFLFPRMTETDRDAISNPPTGLTIFQTDNCAMSNQVNNAIHQVFITIPAHPALLTGSALQMRLQ